MDVASFQTRLGPLDGLLIGRGAVGNPWIFRQLMDPENRPMPFHERIPAILKHAEFAYEYRGMRGLLQFRKHLAAYVRGLRNSKQLRVQLMQADQLEQIQNILHTAVEFTPETV